MVTARHRSVGLLGLAAATLALAACGKADTGDFRSDTENFIEDSDGDVADNLSTTFSDATCTEPSSTDTGSAYSCTATAEDGVVWQFAVEITGDSDYTITTATPMGAGATVEPATDSTSSS